MVAHVELSPTDDLVRAINQSVVAHMTTIGATVAERQRHRCAGTGGAVGDQERVPDVDGVDRRHNAPVAVGRVHANEVAKRRVPVRYRYVAFEGSATHRFRHVAARHEAHRANPALEISRLAA